MRISLVNTDLHELFYSYDHLDFGTIERINQTRGEAVQYIVPLGNQDLFPHTLAPTDSSLEGNKLWFTSTGVRDDQVIEVDWWQEKVLIPRCSNATDTRDLKVICTPAQHNSGL